MNKIYRFSMVVAVALSLVAAGCSPDSADEPVPVDKVEDAEGNDKNPEDNDKNPENNDPIDNTRHDLTLAEGEAEIITSYNSRSLAVLDRLATDETKNVYTSGVSLNILLSMFANGVTGEARAELLDYLGANSLSELNALNTKLMDELVKLDKESVFHIANSLWAAPGFTFLPSCLDLMDATYHASSYSDVPLSTLQGMDEVNKWCSEKTEGLIPKFLDEPLSSPCLAVNALYFKGKWMNKFDETLSSIRVFTAADGTTGYASYMEGFQHVRTCEENGNLCLKIPFGNGAFEFDIIMPAEGTAVSSLLPDPQTVSMLDKAKESIARVRLPKFK
ncbi:MAG: hypothetical protein K2K72_06190, partial [Duncaniella sp.]|nr:hypothetical protein [Duncaniella sp.]